MSFVARRGVGLSQVGAFCDYSSMRFAGLSVEEICSDKGGLLILLGGILALALPAIPLVVIYALMFPLMSVLFWMGMIGGGEGLNSVWETWTSFWPGTKVERLELSVMIIGAIISMVLGIAAIQAYRKVQRGEREKGGETAIMLGVLMLVTLNWLPGIMTLIGGVLCYRTK